MIVSKVTVRKLELTPLILMDYIEILSFYCILDFVSKIVSNNPRSNDTVRIRPFMVNLRTVLRP
jgi:hypothetical protein